MKNVEDCVLGQIFGSYWKGLRKLGIKNGDAHKFGFTVKCNQYDQYPKLDKEWKKQLSKG